MLRIPEWAEGARIEVNGKQWSELPKAGTFSTILRSWRSGDRVDLELPRKLRLEPIDRRHPETVAVLCGPLVLFPLDSGSPPQHTQAELLAVKQAGPELWQIGSQKLLPYVAITDEPYSTYIKVTG